MQARSDALDGPAYRSAARTDADAVARLHAESWRRHYRGAFSDAYLDGDEFADRRELWARRLDEPDPRARTFLAVDELALVGFVHVVLGADATWGALLDNIHVSAGHARRGIGSRLMALAAEVVIAEHAHGGMLLWVLEQNLAAQAFYRARGGVFTGREPAPAPGGLPGRLCGTPIGLRVAWSDAGALL